MKCYQCLFLVFISMAAISTALHAQAQLLRPQSVHQNSIDSLTATEYYHLVQQLNGRIGRLQARSVKTHKLDSVYLDFNSSNSEPLELASKEVFEYSDTLQLVKTYGFSYQVSPSVDGKWTPGSFYKYHLNPKNGLLEKYSFNPSWQGTTIEIDTSTAPAIELFSYNDNSLIDTIEYRSLYPHGLDKISQLRIHVYDSLQQLTQVLDYSRYFGADTLYPYHETKYYHNTYGQLDYLVEYSNTNSLGWAALDSVRWSYNSLRQVVSKLEYGRLVDKSWYLHYEYQQSNYPSGGPDTIEITRYNYDKTLDSRFLEVYIEQESGDPGNMQAQYWRDNIYFGAGYGFFLENDPEISSDRLLFPPFSFFPTFNKIDVWNSMILSEETYNNYWDVQRPIEHFDRPFRRQYFYSEIEPSSIPEQHLEAKAVSVVPNPANEQIRFVMHGQVDSMPYQLQLYNASGELHSTAKYTFGEKYSIANLGPGVYFFQLERNQEVLSGRFVKL